MIKEPVSYKYHLSLDDLMSIAWCLGCTDEADVFVELYSSSLRNHLVLQYANNRILADVDLNLGLIKIPADEPVVISFENFFCEDFDINDYM